ncbi:hypothetical protein C0989_008137 [Termitomyces sp. Mn162]|nr:hypothetical protein C0989_008137 [Termitomyces sp. Mn162]
MAALNSLAAPFVLGESHFFSPEKLSSSDRHLDKVIVYFHHILEIIPDTNKDHLLYVIRDTLSHKDASLEDVVDIILEKIGVEDMRIVRVEDEY